MAERGVQYVRVVGDGQEYTVEDAMNTVGFGKYHWFLVFLAGMAWMGDAMEVMILSYLGPAVSARLRGTLLHRSPRDPSVAFKPRHAAAYTGPRQGLCLLLQKQCFMDCKQPWRKE
jgi:hypothetical protein